MAIAHAHTTGRIHSSASSDGFLLWLSEECWGRGLTRLAELLVAHPSPQELICSPSGRPSSLSHVDPELEGLLLFEGWGLLLAPFPRISAGPSSGITDLGMDATGLAHCAGVEGTGSPPGRQTPT